MDFSLTIELLAFSWLDPASWWAIAKMILGLGAVIFVHELGHFLVAKACGVKCEKFYLGFDVKDIKIGDRVIIPKSLLKFQWGETEYGIGILPLGGYVKMLGQDDNPSNITEERRRSLAAQGKDADDAGPIQRDELDPRSYQAKSVLQRMAIISAGVVMNLIFAVIFATIAFMMGVSYTPTEIGATLPGGPGYEADLDGCLITEVDGKKTVGVFYRFRDLLETTVMHGENELPLMIQRPGESQANQIMVTPRKGVHPDPRAQSYAVIGLSGINTNQVAKGKSAEDVLTEGGAASKASTPILPGDLFININDVKIENGVDLTRELSRNFDKSIDVTIERTDDEGVVSTVKTTIPPNTMMETGIIFEIGEIKSIQINSPAEKAGLKKGDQILTIDGKPVGDPFTLATRMTILARTEKPVPFVVKRGDATKTINVQPRLPRHNSNRSNRKMIGVEPLGIAFEVTRKIVGVEPNSSAAEAGVQNGDIVVAMTFELSDEQKKDPMFKRLRKPIDLTNDKAFWPAIQMSTFQMMRSGATINLTVERNGSEKQIRLVTKENVDKLLEIRGMVLQPRIDVYQTESFWESFKLGLKQTKEDMFRVFKFLKKLVRGEVSVTALGGPGTIAQVATLEASESTPRLLLFLTLISANLAIVNFLPIPVLDGGHMVFLTYEGIFRRPVNEKMYIILTWLGLIFIICLMLFVIGLDVTRFVGG